MNQSIIPRVPPGTFRDAPGVSRRRLLALIAALPILGSTKVRAAGTWPEHTVRLIVPFAAGGPADLYARYLASRLQEAFGQTFLIDNRPGAGSLIGTEAVAKSAPDGYTLLLMSNTHTINESLIPDKPFALMRDFTPIAPINDSDLVLVARGGLPVTSLGDLLKLAKAKPGALSYASSGPGTPYHLAGELFKSMAGVSILHVPYKGSAGARSDVLGGQVDLMFDAVTTMSEQVRAGRVKALATTGLKRSAVLPDVPTVSEAGVPGYTATIWLGLMAPKGTPPAIVQTINTAVGKIAGSAEAERAWRVQGATPMVMSVADFTRYLNQDIAKWARIVKISGAKVDR